MNSSLEKKSKIKDLTAFLLNMGKLKHLKHDIWTDVGSKDVEESVASHSYRMAVITLLTDTPADIDREKCLELAIIHDMYKSATSNGVTNTEEDSSNTEDVAICKIAELLNKNGAHVKALHDEYRNGETNEARFTRDTDRLDTVLQAVSFVKTNKLNDTLAEELVQKYGTEITCPSLLPLVDVIKQKYTLRTSENIQ